MKKTCGKKTGKKSVKKGAIVDGVAINEMTKEQLEGHIHRLQKEIEKEREERNYFQVERDKIASFWEVTKAHLEEKQAELTLQDKRLEEVDILHLSEIKVYKQKMKHIMLEYQNHINSKIKEEMTALQMAENDHHKREALLLIEKEELKNQIIELKKEYNAIIKDIKMRHNQEIKAIRKEFESKIEVTQNELKLEFERIRNELEIRRIKEIHEIEKVKNLHIENIVKTHDKTLADIKNYYNDVTQNNLSLIDAMKNQVKISSKKEQIMAKKAEYMSYRNEEYTKELFEAHKELSKLQKISKRYDEEKKHYTKTRSSLKSFNNEIKQLKWENDALAQKLEKVERDRDALHSKFHTAIQGIKENAQLKTLMLEQKVASLNLYYKKKEHVPDSQLSCPPISTSSDIAENFLGANHSMLWPLKHVANSNLLIKGEQTIQSAKPHN